MFRMATASATLACNTLHGTNASNLLDMTIRYNAKIPD